MNDKWQKKFLSRNICKFFIELFNGTYLQRFFVLFQQGGK